MNINNESLFQIFQNVGALIAPFVDNNTNISEAFNRLNQTLSNDGEFSTSIRQLISEASNIEGNSHERSVQMLDLVAATVRTVSSALDRVESLPSNNEYNKQIVSLFQVKTINNDYKPPQQECTICQDDYKQEDTIMILPCGNVFHENCIGLWLKSNSTCPICRKDVISMMEKLD